MNNVKTRNQSTYLYQDSDPVENQIMWVKSESRNWQKSKITKILDKKTVSGGEEFIVEMREFPGKVITITKYPNKSTRPIQDTYGWTRYPTEDEQEVVDLWDDDFSEANKEDGHELNLYKSVLEEDIGLTAYSKDNGVNRGTKKVILKQGNKNNNSKQDDKKDGRDVDNEQEESDVVTIGADVDLPSFASGTSGYNNIDYLLYSVTCIGGNYVKDGVLSITYASEDKQLLCDHDEWIELLHIEHGIIMLTDSIIQ